MSSFQVEGSTTTERSHRSLFPYGLPSVSGPDGYRRKYGRERSNTLPNPTSNPCRRQRVVSLDKGNPNRGDGSSVIYKRQGHLLSPKSSRVTGRSRLLGSSDPIFPLPENLVYSLISVYVFLFKNYLGGWYTETVQGLVTVLWSPVRPSLDTEIP